MPDMFRTRFKKEIVAEFLPPAHPARTKSSSFCAMACLRFLASNRWWDFSAGKGFWIIYPRYRGAWESGGEFLEKSPHRDILDILDELPTELEEIAFGRRFRLAPDQVFVIGGSFGGAAAIL